MVVAVAQVVPVMLVAVRLVVVVAVSLLCWVDAVVKLSKAVKYLRFVLAVLFLRF